MCTIQFMTTITGNTVYHVTCDDMIVASFDAWIEAYDFCEFMDNLTV